MEARGKDDEDPYNLQEDLPMVNSPQMRSSRRLADLSEKSDMQRLIDYLRSAEQRRYDREDEAARRVGKCRKYVQSLTVFTLFFSQLCSIIIFYSVYIRK